MELLLSDPYRYLDITLLVFVRVMGLFLITPIFSNRNVPYMVKVSLAFFTTMIVINVLEFGPTASSSDVIGFGVAVITEFIIGWLIGFAAYIVFSVLSLAGQFVDMQIGFSMVNVFDPMSQIQLTITGNLYFYLLILIVLITRAHHFFITALVDSFKLIPLGQMTLSPTLYNSLLDYMTRYFELALRIAAPVFFVMLITNVVLGILARTVPQLNMFVIGFPIKIMFGLLTVFVTLSIFSYISDLLISDSKSLIREVIKGMMPR